MLSVQPAYQNKQSNINKMPIHPVYGAYENGWKTIVEFPDYEVNENSQVRHKQKTKLLSDPCQKVKLSSKGKGYTRPIYHLSLLSFFPNVPRCETVDHIDENHLNNFIENLQWMKRGANSAKSNKLRPRKTGPARSKCVEQYQLDGTFIRAYTSVKQTASLNHLSRTRLLECLSGKRKVYRGFVWTYKEEPDLPNEKWQTSNNLKQYLRKRLDISEATINKIQVSNLGRIKTARDKKTKGSIAGMYRHFHSIDVHMLVWLAWGDRLPGTRNGDPEIILHNDSVPYDEDGCVNNAISNLRLGTRADNMIECCKVGKVHKKRQLEMQTSAHANKRQKTAL